MSLIRARCGKGLFKNMEKETGDEFGITTNHESYLYSSVNVFEDL
jgi:hypothetical protein